MSFPIVDRRRLLRTCVQLSGNQSIANNTVVQVVFDQVGYDVGGMYNKTSGIFTVPKGFQGVYQVWGELAMANTGGGVRSTSVDVNGVNAFPNIAQTLAVVVSSSQVCATPFGGILVLNDGDQVTLAVFQTSGGNLNALSSTFMGLARLGNS